MYLTSLLLVALVLRNSMLGSADRFGSYLLSVNIQDKELTPEQEAKRLSYEKALKTAQTKFSKEKSEAFLNWRTDEVAKYFNQSFQSWVADNDPTYFNYEQDVLTADGNYDNCRSHCTCSPLEPS